MIGYTVLDCNRFLTLFTQTVRYKHRNTGSLFNLTVWYLKSASYVTVAFMFLPEILALK